LEAKVLAEQWRIEYNQERPHSSLGKQTPAEFAVSCPITLPITACAASDNLNPMNNKRIKLYF
jgi:hypothetical protein